MSFALLALWDIIFQVVIVWLVFLPAKIAKPSQYVVVAKLEITWSELLVLNAHNSVLHVLIPLDTV